MRMNISRFSPTAFDSLAGDPQAARRLADELEKAVLEEVGAAAIRRFGEVVAGLKALGHRLVQYGPQSVAGEHVRDYTK